MTKRLIFASLAIGMSLGFAGTASAACLGLSAGGLCAGVGTQSVPYSYGTRPIGFREGPYGRGYYGREHQVIEERRVVIHSTCTEHRHNGILVSAPCRH